IRTTRPSLAGRLLRNRIEQLNTMVTSTCSSCAATSMTLTRRLGPSAVTCAGAAGAPSAAAAARSRGYQRRSVLERGIHDPMMWSRQAPDDGRRIRIAVHVAGAAAVGELAHRVELAFDGLGMRSRFEGGCMAGGARAHIGRRRPGHLLRIPRMAGAAGERRQVIARVSAARMAEADEAPLRVAVTGGAVEVCSEMPGGQADRAIVVVAARAGARECRVIDQGGRPGERPVAGIALLRGWNVGARHADRLDRVVTARAGVGCDARVIETRGYPGVGRVTAVAGGIGRHVTRGLARGHGAVVAAHAAARHLCVIDGAHREPGERRVATLAV